MTGAGTGVGEVVVAGWIDWAPQDRRRVLELFAACAATSRKEPGCVDYCVTADVASDARVRVFEHWVSDEALVEHLATPHVRELREQVAVLSRGDRSLSKLTVATSEPMGRSAAATPGGSAAQPAQPAQPAPPAQPAGGTPA